MSPSEPPSETVVADIYLEVRLQDPDVDALMDFFVAMKPADFSGYPNPWRTLVALSKISLALDAACGKQEVPQRFFFPR